MTRFTTENVTRLELDLDRCRNQYGAAPCTAGTDFHTGTSQAGATITTIKLAAAASAVDDFYNGKAITVADRRAIIDDYDGTTRVATVDRDWPINSFVDSEAADLWTQTNVTVVADAIRAPSPFGDLTADKVIETAATGLHQLSQVNADALSVSDVWIVRRRFKAAERSQIEIDFSDAEFGATANAKFDLVAQTTTTGGTGTAVLEVLPDGWFMCEYRATVTTAGTPTAFFNLLKALSNSYAGTLGEGLYVWGAAAAIRESEYIKTGAAAIGLPDAEAYRVLDVDGECYNVFGTCQDTPNYIRGHKTRAFITPGAPAPVGRNYRPWIGRVDRIATEIDLEKGLAPRGRATVTIGDPKDSDVDSDPYLATRSVAPAGTYFARLLARDKHYTGRNARLMTARLAQGWDDTGFITELYVIETMAPPDSAGAVKVTIKDPTKLADRRTLPEASDGKLAAAMDATSLAFQLEAGQGADYPASGFVRIDDEVIEYTSKAGDIFSLSTLADNRGTFGTTAAAHKVSEGAQICQTWQGIRVHQVLVDLYAAAGLPAINIDSAGFLVEDDTWWGDPFKITTAITEPEQVSLLISELLIQTGSYSWWDPVAQLARMKVIAPRTPDEAPIIELTERGHIVGGSVALERLDGLRISVAGIYYDRKSATANRREAVTYLRGELHIDAGAETADEYGDRRTDIIFSRWFTTPNAIAIRATVARRVGRYREAPQRLALRLDGKDAPINTGDLITVTVAQIVDVTGQPATVQALVTRRRDEGTGIALRLRATQLGLRYGFWAPGGTGDYPSDPEFGHWAGPGNFADDTGPYIWF